LGKAIVKSRPAQSVRVVEAQYAGARLVDADRWAFAHYRDAAYAQASAPVEVVRPLASKSALKADEAVALGVIGGVIADAVAEGLRAGQAVAMVGGNCQHATGVLGGLQDAYGADARIGLVWLDAHGDFNTPQTTITGFLGGMPVAVCAGLAWPAWREGSHIAAPLPADRLILCDGRNLDVAEATLLHAVGVPIAAPAPGFPGHDLGQTVEALSEHVDLIYLHVDADILDASYMPNHTTKESNGPNIEQVLTAIGAVMATGKVATYAVVSVFPEGEGGDVSVTAGSRLIGEGLAAWRKYGKPAICGWGGLC